MTEESIRLGHVYLLIWWVSYRSEHVAKQKERKVVYIRL